MSAHFYNGGPVASFLYVHLPDVLVAEGVVPDRSNARRLIMQGAVLIDGRPALSLDIEVRVQRWRTAPGWVQDGSPDRLTPSGPDRGDRFATRDVALVHLGEEWVVETTGTWSPGKLRELLPVLEEATALAEVFNAGLRPLVGS